jgi:endoglucanase
MTVWIRSFAVMGMMALVASGRAEESVAADAFVQNRRLARGINLGNALEAPKEGAWGVVLQSEYFAQIRAAGFSTIRVPVRWPAHAAKEAPFTIDPEFFRRIDWVLEQAAGQRLHVVLNMQHYEELHRDPAGHRTRFIELWRQIAARYRHTPDTVLFELLNEPHEKLDEPIWNALLLEALAAVRESNPVRTIVVGPARWNSIGALAKLELPESEKNLIVTVHFYSPFPFTHQGAPWVKGSEPWRGTEWKGTEAEQKMLNEELDRAVEWSRRKKRPIFLGEFGAYSEADAASRGRWTQFVARAAEARNFSWAYWEFCAGFGAYDPQARQWRDFLLRALVPPS